VGSTFARHDLIDQYRIYLHPLLIGRGRPMLQPSDAKVALQLIDTHTFGNGVILLRYERRSAMSG
jgi:riboflavin biosynthesis pyrimidine reductase